LAAAHPFVLAFDLLDKLIGVVGGLALLAFAVLPIFTLDINPSLPATRPFEVSHVNARGQLAGFFVSILFAFAGHRAVAIVASNILLVALALNIALFSCA
jgi:hypothetical protein